MNTWIALLRGINVGGHRKLPMRALRELLDNLGYRDVSTYIQSGNVVFRSGASDAVELAADIRAAIDERFGFAPAVYMLSGDELVDTVARNPFPAIAPDDRSLHVSFLATEPTSVEIGTLESVAAKSESFELDGRRFYLHAPNGIGRSKLAANVEKLLGVATTSRNWRTISRLVEMVEDASH